jgi:hypothetical protein
MTVLVSIAEQLKQCSDLQLWIDEYPGLKFLLDPMNSPFEACNSRVNTAEDAFSVSPSEFDAVLSSYDSAAAFVGWFHHRPVFLFDGLCWFWEWKNERSCIVEDLTRFQMLRDCGDIIGLRRAYEELCADSYHRTVLIAYHFATQVFPVRGFGTEERLSEYPEFQRKSQLVDAVVNRCVSKRTFIERSHVLFSLSGSIAPIVSLEQNLLFATGALALAIDVHRLFSDMPIVFLCHPELLHLLKQNVDFAKLPPEIVVRASANYKEAMSLIASARAMFVSPGSTSVQEAAFLETPVFFLPEQNGGQPQQFLHLKNAGYELSTNLTVTHLLFNDKAEIGEYDVDRLYAGIREVWSGGMSSIRTKIIRDFISKIATEKAWSDLVRKQSFAVRSIFGGYDGASQVASAILRTLNTG